MAPINEPMIHFFIIVDLVWIDKLDTISGLCKLQMVVYSAFLILAMIDEYRFTVKERFLRYVQVDTQSDPLSTTIPSTEKQKDLGRILGQDIILPDDPTQVITIREHPYLKQKIGEEIITASGNTLLGADDKAGVAIIMDFVNYLMQNPGVKHGKIKILFTPDEEIGRGVNKVDLQKLGADFAYTLDGGERGSFTDETFSADGVVITFHGISAHPGFGKNKLVNALKVAGTFLDLLPRNEFSPETTEDREGFVHPVRAEGIAEKVKVEFIVRDFETRNLKLYETRLEQFAKQAVGKYPGTSYEFEIKQQSGKSCTGMSGKSWA